MRPANVEDDDEDEEDFGRGYGLRTLNQLRRQRQSPASGMHYGVAPVTAYGESPTIRTPDHWGAVRVRVAPGRLGVAIPAKRRAVPGLDG